jgi:hypothetical protein
MDQNMQRLQREGLLPEPGTEAPAAARTPTPAGRRMERHFERHQSRYAAVFRAANTPQYKLAFTVVGMVIGVWWGMRWPRRLTVLAIAVEAQNAVIRVPWLARAVQRRRPRIATGQALVIAGSVARQQRLNRSGDSRPAAATATREHRGNRSQPTSRPELYEFSLVSADRAHLRRAGRPGRCRSNGTEPRA